MQTICNSGQKLEVCDLNKHKMFLTIDDFVLNIVDMNPRTKMGPPNDPGDYYYNSFLFLFCLKLLYMVLHFFWFYKKKKETCSIHFELRIYLKGIDSSYFFFYKIKRHQFSTFKTAITNFEIVHNHTFYISWYKNSLI